MEAHTKSTTLTPVSGCDFIALALTFFVGRENISEKGKSFRYTIGGNMFRSLRNLWLLCIGLLLCVCSFTPMLLAQKSVDSVTAPIQTGPIEIWEDHHDTSLPLTDMIRLYPQPPLPLEHFVHPVLPIPPRYYPPGQKDGALQTMKLPGRLAPSIGLNFEGQDFDTTCNCAPPDRMARSVPLSMCSKSTLSFRFTPSRAVACLPGRLRPILCGAASAEPAKRPTTVMVRWPLTNWPTAGSSS